MTHDLELTDLERSISGLTNSHFQETVTAGTLQFDYTLRQALPHHQRLEDHGAGRFAGSSSDGLS